MGMEDYVDYSKLKSLKDIYEYIDKFNLSMHNIEKFKSEVSSAIMSLDSEIKSNVEFLKTQKAEIKEIINSPEVKGKIWTGDIWYRISQMQELLINSLFRISAYKTWMIKFLAVSNNKFAEFSEALSNQAIDLKKLEAQVEIWKEMFQVLKEQQANQPASAQNNDILDVIKKQMEKQEQFTSALAQQLETFKWILNTKQPPQQVIQNPEVKIEPVQQHREEPTEQPEEPEEPEPTPTEEEPEPEIEDAKLRNMLEKLEFVEPNTIEGDKLYIVLDDKHEVRDALGITSDKISKKEAEMLLQQMVDDGTAGKYVFRKKALASALCMNGSTLDAILEKNGLTEYFEFGE